jgi:hypothetical protein
MKLSSVMPLKANHQNPLFHAISKNNMAEAQTFKMGVTLRFISYYGHSG